MENPIKMDDLGVPLFSETPMYEINHSIVKWIVSGRPLDADKNTASFIVIQLSWSLHSSDDDEL